MESSHRDDDIVLPEGLRLRPAEPVQTKFGQIRKFGSLTSLEKSFLVIGLLGVLMSLGFSVEKIVSSAQSSLPESDEDLVLAIVLTINIGFCFFYIIDGVITEKPYELIIFIVADLIVTGYVIGNYAYRCVQSENPHVDNSTLHEYWASSNVTTTPAPSNFCVDAVKLSRLILTLLLSPPAVAMGIYAAHDYIVRGEFVFRMVGADRSLQTACKILFAAVSIIKLDLQLQLSMLILILHEDVKVAIDLTEILILSIGVPFSLMWAIGSYFSLRLENKILLIIVVVTSVIEPGYIGYRMYTAGLDVISADHKLLSFVTFLFGAGALISRAVHVFLLFMCWRNFQRGLKERVFQQKSQ